MVNQVVVGAVAFAVAAVATWIAARGARVAGLLDRPGPRKPHPAPVPLAGGVGMAVGITAGVAVAGGAGAGALLAAGWALVLLGVADDARDLRARTRLVGQAAAVLPAVLVYAPSVGVPRGLEVALGLVWVLAVISALNCIDCADGVAGGVGVSAALALGALGGWTGPLAPAVAGASGGFLLLNAPPARCFLGEAGSTLLGFLLAVLVLAVPASVHPHASRSAALGAATVLAVPVLDFVLVHARRVRAGVRSVAELMASAGTDHLPHRLARRGLSPGGVAAACAAFVGACGVAATVVSRGGLGTSLLFAALVAATFLVADRLVVAPSDGTSRERSVLRAAGTGLVPPSAATLRALPRSGWAPASVPGVRPGTSAPEEAS